MFGAAGHAYVYRSYGIHWMLNLVCGEEGDGQAVLVRALIPTSGRAAIAARRTGRDVRDWCRGPGRLGAALAIGPALDRLPLDRPPFAVVAADAPVPVIATARIGISKAIERPWRFVAADAARWLSVPAVTSAR
jgi:DNA-3-methyladenine glycosylase